MRETADGTLMLDADDCRKVAGVCEWLDELLSYLPADGHFTEYEWLRFFDSARYWYAQYGPLRGPIEATTDRRELLEGFRSLARSSKRIPCEFRAAGAPAAVQAVLRELAAMPPPLTWDITATVTPALMQEFGARAARMLRRARRKPEP